VRRADQVAGALLFVFGIWFAVAAWRQHPYWTSTGPGSGFLPLWLGGTMAVLACALLVGATRRTDAGPRWLPGGRGFVRLVVVVGAVALFVALMPILGMVVCTALFLVGVLRFLEGHGWAVTLGVAMAATTANWLVFSYWLHVPFPIGVLGF
jgi:putative tricarboxylic transport membrane protein